MNMSYKVNCEINKKYKKEMYKIHLFFKNNKIMNKKFQKNNNKVIKTMLGTSECK